MDATYIYILSLKSLGFFFSVHVFIGLSLIFKSRFSAIDYSVSGGFVCRNSYFIMCFVKWRGGDQTDPIIIITNLYLQTLNCLQHRVHCRKHATANATDKDCRQGPSSPPSCVWAGSRPLAHNSDDTHWISGTVSSAAWLRQSPVLLVAATSAYSSPTSSLESVDSIVLFLPQDYYVYKCIDCFPFSHPHILPRAHFFCFPGVIFMVSYKRFLNKVSSDFCLCSTVCSFSYLFYCFLV